MSLLSWALTPLLILNLYQDVWHGRGEDHHSRGSESLWPGGEEDLRCGHHKNPDGMPFHDGHGVHQTLVGLLKLSPAPSQLLFYD